MFKGILSEARVDSRAARRLATVAAAVGRPHHHRQQRETLRQSTRQLHRLRERQAGERAQHRVRSFSKRHNTRQLDNAARAMQAGWTAAQAEALAQEDAAWQARDPMRQYEAEARKDFAMEDDGDDADRRGASVKRGAGSASPPLHYDAVDAETGQSVVQQNFDALVYRALIRYGPPLPVEVVVHNHVISAASLSPDQRRAHAQERQRNSSLGGADDPNAVYMDEVGLKMHEVMSILRREQPHFSVREDCDGVPLSLLVRNCCYLRAYGGKVNYMRFVRRLPRESAEAGGHETAGTRNQKSSMSDDPADAGNTMVLSLGKYKMREMASQDGIRQGPQPWRYSYRTL